MQQHLAAAAERPNPQEEAEAGRGVSQQDQVEELEVVPRSRLSLFLSS